MIRALKMICTANFVLSILLYGGYVTYFLSNGISIDHRWGIGHSRAPVWAVVAFLELQLLAIFVMGRFSDTPQTLRFRLAFILWGILILFLWVGYWAQSAVAPIYDFHLVGYVGISDVAYGLLGNNATQYEDGPHG